MTRNCSHQDEANNNTKSNHSAGNELKDPLSRIEAALQHHKMTTLTVICNFTNFKQDGGENLSQRNRNYVIQGKKISPRERGKFSVVVWPDEKYWKYLLQCTQQKKSITASAWLLQPNGFLPTSRCHINFCPVKYPPPAIYGLTSTLFDHLLLYNYKKEQNRCMAKPSTSPTGAQPQQR